MSRTDVIVVFLYMALFLSRAIAMYLDPVIFWASRFSVNQIVELSW